MPVARWIMVEETYEVTENYKVKVAFDNYSETCCENNSVYDRVYHQS